MRQHLEARLESSGSVCRRRATSPSPELRAAVTSRDDAAAVDGVESASWLGAVCVTAPPPHLHRLIGRGPIVGRIGERYPRQLARPGRSLLRRTMSSTTSDRSLSWLSGWKAGVRFGASARILRTPTYAASPPRPPNNLRLL